MAHLTVRGRLESDNLPRPSQWALRCRLLREARGNRQSDDRSRKKSLVHSNVPCQQIPQIMREIVNGLLTNLNGAVVTVVGHFAPYSDGVIPKPAFSPAGRRISRLTGPTRKPNCTTTGVTQPSALKAPRKGRPRCPIFRSSHFDAE